ncbi:MAG: cell division protein ZapA [Acidiferrobacterales bacterium]|nr:cell division protein ZapA [Acidiferrobacterales bacterium]
MQREFTIACTDEEASGVMRAAEYLDNQMRQIVENNQALGADRCAIMAALNISHELLEARENIGEDSDVSDRLEKLHDQIDDAMGAIRQVAI